MAVRLLTYVGLLLEYIVRKESLKPGDRLPPVLPLMVYSACNRWRAPLRLLDYEFTRELQKNRHLSRGG
jgi:hypothetical protein